MFLSKTKSPEALRLQGIDLVDDTGLEFGLNLYRPFLCVQNRRYWCKNIHKVCRLISPCFEAEHGFKGNCKGNFSFVPEL